MGSSGGLDQTLDHLMNGSMFEMLNAASSMKTYGDAAVKRLIQALQDQDRETRWKAAVALGEVGTPAVKPLITVISTGMDAAKMPAIWALQKIGDPRAVEPLVEALSDDYECCRWMAAAALQQIGDLKAISAVNAALANEPDDVRGFVEELIEGS